MKQVKIGNTITLSNNIYEENNGNLKQTTYGNNDTIHYEYDEFDRIKKVIKEDASYYYKYDNNGSLTKIESANNNIIYNYDLSKKLNEYRYNDLRMNYTYDKNNNLIDKICKFNDFYNEITNTYNDEDVVTKTSFGNNEINYNYDELGRLKNRDIDNQFHTNYEYVSHGNRTSMLVKSIENNNDKYSYRYDELANITDIFHNGILENQYYYDDYNELVEEKDYITNRKISYLYDNSGNILNKKYYNLSTGILISQEEYQYNNLNWKDQLTSCNEGNITYDAIGNPVTIGTYSLEWINGRQLKRYGTNHYKYNLNGIRTSKIVNGVETKYYVEDSKIVFEQKGNDVIYYIYDDIDSLIGFEYNNTIYYYIKNIFNDIIGILDSNYNVIVNYYYDSWGNVSAIGNMDIANINPFRYRSYYYDQETGLYYLNSRYYNPEWGRFLNADGIIGANRDILGYNLYAYCSNNPVSRIDFNGNVALSIISAPLIQSILAENVKKKGNQYYYNPNASNKLSTPVYHYYNPKESNRKSCNVNRYYCDFNENNGLKLTSIVSTGYGIGLSTSTGLTIGGVSILDAGYSNQRITRIENGKLFCYRIKKVGFTKYIGIQKYSITPLDCSFYSDVPIGETIFKTEFQFFSARWNKEDGLYSDYTTSANFYGFEVNAGYVYE